jgi:prepilin-type N-terminal cleavage/methylation domain-containing protein
MIATSMPRRGLNEPEHGFTLLELIIATAILLVPRPSCWFSRRCRWRRCSGDQPNLLKISRAVQRGKERQLRIDLWERRDSVDRYKDAADRGGFRTKTSGSSSAPDTCSNCGSKHRVRMRLSA